MKAIRYAIAAFVFCGLTASGVSESARAAILITPQPPASARALKAPSQPAPQSSQITVSFDMPLAKMQAFVNQYNIAFKEAGTYGIWTYDLDIKIGKVALSASGDDAHPIRMSAPFSLTGRASVLPLDESGRATIDLGAEFGTDWCPGPTYANLGISLNASARTAAYRRRARSFGDLSGPIAYFVGADLKKRVNCEAFKEAIAGIWSSQDWPFRVNNKTFFLGTSPQALALSKITVVGDRAVIAVTLTTGLSISNKEVPSRKLKLPDMISPISSPKPGQSSADVDGSLHGNVGLDLR